MNKGPLDTEDLQRLERLKDRYNKLVVQIEKLLMSTPKLQELQLSRKPLRSSLKESAFESLAAELDDDISDELGENKENDYETANRPTVGPHEVRHYMKETFNSRQAKKLPDERRYSDKKEEKQRTRSPPSANPQSRNTSAKKPKEFGDQLNVEWIDSLLRQFGTSNTVTKKPSLQRPTSQKNASSAVKGKEISGNAWNVKSYKESPALEVLRKELEAIKTVCAGFLHKIDTHNHPEYENDLEKLRLENTKILADYKILQQENTEMVKEIHAIKKEVKSLEKENDSLFDQMRKLRVKLKENERQESENLQITLKDKQKKSKNTSNVTRDSEGEKENISYGGELSISKKRIKENSRENRRPQDDSDQERKNSHKKKPAKQTEKKRYLLAYPPLPGNVINTGRTIDQIEYSS